MFDRQCVTKRVLRLAQGGPDPRATRGTGPEGLRPDPDRIQDARLHQGCKGHLHGAAPYGSPCRHEPEEYPSANG